MAARQITSEETNAIREISNSFKHSRKSKKAPLRQKIIGATMLIFSCVAPIVLDGDITISVFTLPMALMLIFTKKKVIW